MNEWTGRSLENWPENKPIGFWKRRNVSPSVDSLGFVLFFWVTMRLFCRKTCLQDMVLQANVGLIYCWDLLTRRNEAHQSIRCREWKWWRSLHMWICLSNQTQQSELFQSTAMLWHSVTSSLDLETRGAAARAAERSSCFCARWLTVMGYSEFNGA